MGRLSSLNLLNNITIEVGWKKIKKTIEVDPKIFPICSIKEHEFGVVRKRVVYIHRDKDQWHLLVLPDCKCFKFKG